MLHEIEQLLVEDGLIDIEPSGKKTVDGRYYSPDELIQSVKAVMGDIDVDPCSTRLAQKRIRAKTYYDERKDGLKHDWPGRVYLNPDHDDDMCVKFLDKLSQQFFHEITTECIGTN